MIVTAQTCDTFQPVNTKKVLIGFGDLMSTAAQSRNTAQSCGFLLRAQVLVARMGGRKTCRFNSSAVLPVRQPVRAASPFGDGRQLSQSTTGATLAQHKLDACVHTLDDAFTTLSLIQTQPDIPEHVRNALEHLIGRICDTRLGVSE